MFERTCKKCGHIYKGLIPLWVVGNRAPISHIRIIRCPICKCKEYK